MVTCTTRSAIEEHWRQFSRVMIDVLGIEEDHPIMIALKGESISTFNDLHILTSQGINTLTYTIYIEMYDGESAAISNSLVKGHKGWLKALLAFTRYYDIDMYEQIDNISLHELNKFHMGIYNLCNN